MATMGALAYDLIISFGLCILGVLSEDLALPFPAFIPTFISCLSHSLGLAWFFRHSESLFVMLARLDLFSDFPLFKWCFLFRG